MSTRVSAASSSGTKRSVSGRGPVLPQAARIRCVSQSLIGGLLGRLFRAFLPLGAAGDVVAAGVAAVQAAGVHRSPADARASASSSAPAAPPPPFHETLDRRGQQRVGALLRGEQALGRLLQRGEVRHVLQAQHLYQVRQVEQHRRDAAVVGLEEGLEHQAGEELRLGVDLGAVAVGVQRQGLRARFQRLHRHHPWRLAGATHLPVLRARGAAGSGSGVKFSTEQDEIRFRPKY